MVKKLTYEKTIQYCVSLAIIIFSIWCGISRYMVVCRAAQEAACELLKEELNFLFFLLRCESYHKTQKDYPITLKFGTLKGSTSWYPIWLQYHKWPQSYKQLFAKNNTNMLSCLQGKPLMARSWKSARRQGNYWTSNLFVIWKKLS